MKIVILTHIQYSCIDSHAELLCYVSANILYFQLHTHALLALRFSFIALRISYIAHVLVLVAVRVGMGEGRMTMFIGNPHSTCTILYIST